MARNLRSQKSVVKHAKVKGPNMHFVAKKTKTMDELLGISAMEIEPVIQSEEDNQRHSTQSANS